MLGFFNLKLYRKFLVIGVMLAGLYLVSSTRQVAASACCDACLATYDSCIDNCYMLYDVDPLLGQCLLTCGNNYEPCSRACGHGTPACIAV